MPLIIERGAEWFAKLGPEKNGGPKLFCISGHVKRPGTYEAPMTVTLKDLIYDEKFAGGIRGGHQLKCVIPGGSSVPVLLPDQIDVPASFDGIAQAGSLLGSAGIIVMDETTCMVWAAENLLHFYKHESCGKCTPCREGGDWLHRILGKIERGEGEMRDLDLLLSISNNILGKTLCAFGDAAATPVLSTVKMFRAEYEAHIREGRCTVPAPWRARRASHAGGALDADAVRRLDHPSSSRSSTRSSAWSSSRCRSRRPCWSTWSARSPRSSQQRYGPYLVGPRGLLQPIADIVKLIFKEELRPKSADTLLFYVAPVLSRHRGVCRVRGRAVRRRRRRSSACSTGRSIWPSADVNVGLLVIFAITSMGVYGIVLAGWASNSKYSLLGGLRSSAQMISYELSYGLSFAAVIMLAGSLSLREIVDSQAGYWFGFIPKWYLFLQPLGFFIFLTAGVAETNRAPFDFPEAEQELVAGYHTEYSSMSFALFFLAEYVNMVTVSAVATDLFLGGWHGPFPLPAGFGWIWFLLKTVRAALLLYLDALDAAALPLRPVDGVRLEVAAAGGGHQSAGDGVRRHRVRLLRRAGEWTRCCSGSSRRSRSWRRCSSSGSATRCTACCC